MKRLILITALLFVFTKPIANHYTKDTSDKYRRYYNEFAKWEYLYIAICEVESGSNPTKVGTKGDGGIIQILPENAGGYLDEANRLLGFKRFKDKDRFCPVKSREIWEVVMKYRNPERSLLKAIRLHNPRAGKWYAERVTKKYEEFTKKIK